MKVMLSMTIVEGDVAMPTMVVEMGVVVANAVTMATVEIV